jgi:tripartite motif-containing protein 2/3
MFCQNCKTFDILITHNSFTSNLTGRNFCSKTFEKLTCKSSNVVYGIGCDLCGLIYVGETKAFLGSLQKRISGHRFQINNGGIQLLLYKHFNSPDHCILSMRVRILEKIYHHTNSPTLSTPFPRQREDFWIKTLGTAFPYGCNDNIANVGNLTAPQTVNVNVMRLLPHRERRRSSHGHRIQQYMMSHLTHFCLTSKEN